MKIDIKQIYYRNKQILHMDESFGRFDNTKNTNPEWHEYHIFDTNYDTLDFTHTDYYGFVSWKFRLKTGIDGRDFLEFVQANPGYDVYFINPFVEYPLLFRNVWSQGEHFHPGLTALASEVLSGAGHQMDLGQLVHDESNAAFCNYWVGNQRFWDRYMKFTRPVRDYIRGSAGTELRTKLHARADVHINASYITFIMERLFSTLLTEGDLRFLGYQHSQEHLTEKWSDLYDLLPILRSAKAIERGSLSIDEMSAKLISALRHTALKYKKLEFEFTDYQSPARELITTLKRKIKARIL